jgi:hypothetical protein
MKTTVQFVQAARKAGMDMREVSERLNAAIGVQGGLQKWRKWIRQEILKGGRKKELALGH